MSWRGVVLVGVAIGSVAPLTMVAGATAIRSGDEVPAECRRPPLVMRLEGRYGVPSGGSGFEVTDVIARRVPIVPSTNASTGDPEFLEKQRDRAATTSLAYFSIYLADFEIPRRELKTSGFGDIEPKPGGTIGTLSIVPTRRRGLRAGDVVRDDELGYDTTTTFTSLSLIVRSSENQGFYPYTDVSGRVKVLALSDEQICVDIDVEFSNSGDLMTAAEGVLVAPVVRAPDDFFFS